MQIYTLNSKRNYTLCFRASTQNVGGLGPQTSVHKRPIGVLHQTLPGWRKTFKWFKSLSKKSDSMSCRKVHKILFFPLTPVLLADDTH